MPEKITTEDLAGMIQRGFEETSKKADMGRQFTEVNVRLDRIENLMPADHKRRIKKLKQDGKDLKNALAM